MANTIEFQGFPKIPRLSREMVITEKIDGTNGQIYISTQEEIDNGWAPMLVGSRTRWIDLKSDNHGFAKWAYEHQQELIEDLGPGRHYGEWWGQGVQRGYGLKEKRFSLFNVKRWGDAILKCCHVVPVLYRGLFITSLIEHILGLLEKHGSQAAPGFMKPEGIVIYHTAGNYLFKKTIEKDNEPKGKEV